MLSVLPQNALFYRNFDARLFFNCENWSIECGGFTSYVAKDEDEPVET